MHVYGNSPDLNSATEAEQIASVSRRPWDIEKIKNPSEQVQLAAVSNSADGYAIKSVFKSIKNPSEAIQLAAVSKRGSAIKHIIEQGIEPSERVQIAAVKNGGAQFVMMMLDPSDTVKLAAVEMSPFAIEYIKSQDFTPAIKIAVLKKLLHLTKTNYVKARLLYNALRNKNLAWSELDTIEKKLKQQGIIREAHTNLNDATEAEQIQAVTQHGWKIVDIFEPSEAVQLAAVKSGNGRAIQYITNPSELVQIAAAKNYYDTITTLLDKGIKPSLPVQLAALERSPVSVEDIETFNPNIWENTQAKRLLLKGLINYINTKRSAIAFSMIKDLRKRQIQWPELDVIEKKLNDRKTIRENFEHLNDASEDKQIAAVSTIPKRIQYIDNPSIAVQLAAIKTDGIAIDYIDNPSEAVQLAAVNRNVWAIDYIKKPTMAVYLAAIRQDGRAVEGLKNSLITAEIKILVLQHLIRLIKINNDWDARDLYNMLRRKKLPWPELDTLEKHMKAKNML